MSNTKHSINHRKITPRLSDKSLLKHFLPDDASRVKLSNVDDDPCSDYINASYIPVSEPLGREAWMKLQWVATLQIPLLLNASIVLRSGSIQA